MGIGVDLLRRLHGVDEFGEFSVFVEKQSAGLDQILLDGANLVGVHACIFIENQRVGELIVGKTFRIEFPFHVHPVLEISKHGVFGGVVVFMI